MAWNWEAEGDLLSRLLLPIWKNDASLRPEAVFRAWMTDGGEVDLDGPRPELRSPDRMNPVDTIERWLHIFLASEAREAVFVHAGVVEWQGQAILLPGRSWAGKSTLVQALVAEGARFMSDEYAVVDSQGLVHPFPRPLSLRNGGVGLRIEAQDLGWSPKIPPLKAKAVITTSFDPQQCWSPQESTQGGALMDLLANTVAARSTPQFSLNSLGKLVKDAVCWRGARGEAGPTARSILGAL